MSEIVEVLLRVRNLAQHLSRHCPAGQYPFSSKNMQVEQIQWSFNLWDRRRTTWFWLQRVHLPNPSEFACGFCIMHGSCGTAPLASMWICCESPAATPLMYPIHPRFINRAVPHADSWASH
eukprot:8418374-Heterocapsa_arctica.AAC.1